MFKKVTDKPYYTNNRLPVAPLSVSYYSVLFRKVKFCLVQEVPRRLAESFLLLL